MRVIARRMLREFWESRPVYADAVRPLTEWYRHIIKARYCTPQELKADLRTVSVLKGGRVVFNIAGNKYRVVALISYERQICRVRFVGTHAQYDKIHAEEV